MPPLGTKKRSVHPLLPTRDHVVPKSVMPGQGVLFACQRCNLDKGALLLEQWHTKLVSADDPRAGVVKEFMRARPWARLKNVPGRTNATDAPLNDLGGSIF